MPAGANAKREREYTKLEQRFKQEHRYPGREEEVASRIVNKQRKQYSETRSERGKDKAGASPDRNLPIEGYDHLTISQLSGRLEGLSASELRKLRHYESKHKNRKGLMEKLERLLTRH
jgi:hypothetical protein